MMKKLLLVISAVALSSGVYAQARFNQGVTLKPTSIPMKAVKVEKQNQEIIPLKATTIPSTAANFSPVTASFGAVTETLLGQTLYDLQSNRGSAQRVVNHGNGTLSAVWTNIPAPAGVSADRGTGYGYFDGSTWSVVNRIESQRTGFTNIDVAGGIEYVCSHSDNNINGLILSKRPVGSGAWTSTSVGNYTQFTNQSDVWSRMAVGGANNQTVHVIVNSQGSGTVPVLNQNGPLTYSRSTDGGVTWDIDHIRLPDSDENFSLGFSAEDYHIDARGDVVAVVAGGFDQSTWLWKSTDNGSTWTKTTVIEFPIPLYDGATMISDADGDMIADTIETGSSDPTVSIDANGICHVVSGRMFMLDDVDVDPSSYFPTTDGLFYWNETMSAPAIVAGAEDLDGNGFIDLPTPNAPNTQPLGLYGIAGMLTHGTIGFDTQNNIYITYAAPNELADTSVYQCAHRHVYVIASADNGATWSTPYNIVPMLAAGGDGEYQEAVWPSLAREVEGDANSEVLHIVYQRDIAPYYSTVFGAYSTNAGIAEQQAWNMDQFSQTPLPSDIIYARVTDVLTTGINENNIAFNVAVAPNPASDIVNLTFALAKTADLNFEVVDILGNQVMKQYLGTRSAGNNAFTFDVSKLKAGAYLYTLSSSEFKTSGKLIVK